MKTIYVIQTINDGTIHSAYGSLIDAQIQWDTLDENIYEIVPFFNKDNSRNEI